MDLARGLSLQRRKGTSGSSSLGFSILVGIAVITNLFFYQPPASPLIIRAAAISTRTVSESISLKEVVVSDGHNFGGREVPQPIVGFREEWALIGDDMPATLTGALTSGVGVGDYLYLAPYSASMVVRVHKDSGATKEYSNFPVGYSLHASASLNAPAYHAKTNKIFFAPVAAQSHLLILNLATDQFELAPWPPAALTPWTYSFGGGTVAGDDWWLCPIHARQIVSVNLNDPTQTTVLPSSSYPAGFTFATYLFSGVINENDEYGWFTANQIDRIVRVDFKAHTMTGHLNWPVGHTSGSHAGGTFDGQTIWVVPSSASGILGIDKDDPNGIPYKNYQDYPVGMSASTAVAKFSGASFDGRFVWGLPRQKYGSVVRLDPLTGAMISFFGYVNADKQISCGSFMDMKRSSFYLFHCGTPQGISRVKITDGSGTATPSASNSLDSTISTIETFSATATPTISPDDTSSSTRTISEVVTNTPLPTPSPVSTLTQSPTETFSVVPSRSQIATVSRRLFPTGTASNLESSEAGSSDSNDGSSRSPDSPLLLGTPSPQGSEIQRWASPIFSLSLASAPCIDALLLTWIIFICLIPFLVLLWLGFLRPRYNILHHDNVGTSELIRRVEEEGNSAAETVEALSPEEKEVWSKLVLRSSWEGTGRSISGESPSLLRSVISKHHSWLAFFSPCHDECLFAHTFLAFNHVLTLLWLSSAVVVLAPVGSNFGNFAPPLRAGYAVFVALLAQVTKPLLSFYYSFSNESCTAETTSSSSSQDQSLGEKESSSNDVADASSQPNRPLSAQSSSVKSIIKTDVLDDLEVVDNVDDEVYLSEVQLQHQRSVTSSSSLGSPPSKSSAAASQRKPTFLSRCDPLHDDEEENTVEENPRKANSSNSLSSDKISKRNCTACNSSRSFLVHSETKQFKLRGHTVNTIYFILSSVLCFLLGYAMENRPEQSSSNVRGENSECRILTLEVIPVAILVDILIVQPLYLCIGVLGYRYMMAAHNTTDSPFGGDTSLHPRNCTLVQL